MSAYETVQDTAKAQTTSAPWVKTNAYREIIYALSGHASTILRAIETKTQNRDSTYKEDEMLKETHAKLMEATNKAFDSLVNPTTDF